MLESFNKSLENLLVHTLGIRAELAFILKALIMIVSTILFLYVVWAVSRWVLNRFLPKLTSMTETTWDDIIFNNRVISSIALLIPAMILYVMAPVVFAELSRTLPIVEAATYVVIIFTIALILSSILSSANDVLATNPDFKDKPIGSITQLGKILVYSIAIVLTISVIFDKSPVLLLSGFGAVAAIFLLVFKDSILGFVASVQLSANNMVHVGDWVTVPKFNADGGVLEINLTTIKVQNFDNTITTIPTYAFVSDSFTNWRGMVQSPGRRIKRSINIQIQSIRFCTPEMIERFKKFILVAPYIEERQAEISAFNIKNNIDSSVIVNGRKLTNIGVFRVYLENYLKANSKISQELTVMVRQLPSTSEGLPLEIYAFSIVKEWKAYEGVMSDIFDHIFAAIDYFDLKVFEKPSSFDYHKLIDRD